MVSRGQLRMRAAVAAGTVGLLVLAGCAATSANSAKSSSAPSASIERNAAGSSKDKALISAQRLKVERQEDSVGSDEPVIHVLAWSAEVGNGNIWTHWASEKPRELGDAASGETIDLADDQADFVFTAPTYSDEDFEQSKPLKVVGTMAMLFDGDSDAGWVAHKNVKPMEQKLKDNLSSVFGGMDMQNYDSARELIEAAAERINGSFDRGFWTNVWQFFVNYGDSDDYVGTAITALVPVTKELAEPYETDNIVGATDVSKIAALTPDEALKWDFVLDNRSDDVRYRLHMYADQRN